MASPFAPFFTTNEADIVALEGLYVKERNPPASIQGINLNGVGMVGEAVRGPVDEVIQINSESRFLAVFGRDQAPSDTSVTNDLWKALLNKRFGRLFMVRAAASDAVAADRDFLQTATPIIDVAAASVGTWGNDITIDIENATDGNVNHFNLKVNFDNNTVVYKNLDVSTGNNNLLQTIGDDDANLVVVTKLADGRPDNIAAQALDGTAGSNGTIADSDFTAAGKGIPLLSTEPGVAAVVVTGRMNAAIKAQMATEAAASSDRMFLMGADDETVTSTSAASDAANYRSDRIVYCYNHPNTLNPETATEVVSEPWVWMASIFSQTDVNDHVGADSTKSLLAGVRSLAFPELSRNDFIALKDAGVAGMGRDLDGHVFVSGITTSLTPGLEEIARRRSADFIQLSLANALKPNVKAVNTPTRRAAIRGAIEAFLDNLAGQERIVASDDAGVGQFSVDENVLTSQADLDAGILRVLIRVKLISHILHLVLETEIGTAVNVTEVS